MITAIQTFKLNVLQLVLSFYILFLKNVLEMVCLACGQVSVPHITDMFIAHQSSTGKTGDTVLNAFFQITFIVSHSTVPVIL